MEPKGNKSMFEGNPEDLRIENEILKLKMQAESGAVFGMSSDLPPEVEHIFLQHICSVEEARKNAKQVRLYDLIGKPDYKKEIELDDQHVEEELNNLLYLLACHNITFNTSGDHEARTIYRFITEELFDMEISDMDLPGMTKHIIYGEGEEQ